MHHQRPSESSPPMRKSTLKRRPAKRRPRKAKANTRGSSPADARLESVDRDTQAAADAVERCGGVVVGQYRDPLGGQPLLVAVLPLEAVEPTPFQRDVSDTHHKRLADVLDRTGMFLDPILAITAPHFGFWTPNGGHRLAAMRRLGARSITALVVPKREVAWQILALNTEKAHNLKDKSLEVIRIFRNLLEEQPVRAEREFGFYFEEAAFITLGLCYEKNPRFSGGVYHPFVRRLLEFDDAPLRQTLAAHEKHAERLLDLDARVGSVVQRLKDKGFVSPYLKAFVVARCNPLRFMKEPPALEDLMRTIREGVDRFNVDKVRQEDITASGGAADEE